MQKLKELGAYSQFALDNGIHGFMSFAANIIGWSKEEVGVYIIYLQREIRNSKLHSIIRLKAVWGRNHPKTEHLTNFSLILVFLCR